MHALRVAVASLVVLGACRPHAPPSNVTARAAGVSIAIYSDAIDRYAIVDDRRWVEVAGAELVLPNIDPNADLASLVIEPASDALRVGRCTRDAQVRCAVTARAGRYLLRLVYVTRGLAYHARHDITLRDPARVAIVSRFHLDTPTWRSRAELVVFDGRPGADGPPREVARGSVMLDGSTATLATTREATAQVRRIYEGAVVTSSESSDAAWNHDSMQAVVLWLELEGARLTHGTATIHVELPDEQVRAVEVDAAKRRQSDAPGGPLRLPLWVDESLRGSRQRIVEQSDGATLVERYQFAVENTGDRERVVFVDEPLRRAARKKLDRAWPHKPVVAGTRLRTKLVIAPGATERTGYTLTYDF